MNTAQCSHLHCRQPVWSAKWQLQLGSFSNYTLIKSIINDETLEQVSQFTYLGCSISYQFPNDVESKLAKFLQLIGTINTYPTNVENRVSS